MKAQGKHAAKARDALLVETAGEHSISLDLLVHVTKGLDHAACTTLCRNILKLPAPFRLYLRGSHFAIKEYHDHIK